MRLRISIALLIVLLASSCGGYEKILKSTDFDLKKAKAKEYFEAAKYIKSTELIEQILPRFRASESGEDLTWMIAQSYYGMKQYDIAGSYFSSYVDQFGYGKHIEESTFMSALCEYNSAPRAELDQDNTRKAIEGFKIFLARYPYNSRSDECKKLMTDLQERLVEKSYLSAKLYYDMTQYKAAVTALSNSLKEYAETKYREEMMFLKLSSLSLYAKNSYDIKQKERYQATLDDYYSFMEEFPKSLYAKDVKKIYEDTARYLKIDTETPKVNIQ
ncbi:MAG: outer membrane protein assembly factor BamD [Bacteroidia bacterium]|jgi:outer membrane protein assembly factor BamD|nr:outer membrane protein assembly factor BamD [Bacteroidia bacterium]